MSFNPRLLDCAQYAINTKAAFVAPGMAPDPMAAAGGAPPGAPPPGPPAAAGAGAPPAPPMDPAMAAGGAPPAPPVDPAAAAPPGGGAPPAPPPAPPSPGGFDPEMIRSIIREEMAQGGAAGQKPKAPKVTPEQMYQEALRTRKMVTHMFGLMGWGLPPDILDDPPPGGEGGGEGGGAKPAGGSSGGSSGGQSKSAIAPIKPVTPAFPMGKAASSRDISDSADALLRVLRGE